MKIGENICDIYRENAIGERVAKNTIFRRPSGHDENLSCLIYVNHCVIFTQML